MRRFHRSLQLCCCVAVLGACAKNETPKADTAAAPAAAPAAPAAVTLADFAGKWNMRVLPEAPDTTVTTYVLTATADSSGWKNVYPNGMEVQSHVMLSGDSVVTDAGPFASVRRKGLKVTTHGVLRREGDKLVGTTTAHYKTTKPDSVLQLRIEGTRAQ